MDADRSIADLDPDQRAAVTTPSTLVAVIAGAGSGKTRVLTRRISHRVETGTADARHTLALTFTREAAGELRRRLLRLGLRDHVEAGTFHSVMLNVLRQRWADTDRSPRTVQPDRRRLLAEVRSESSGSIDHRSVSAAADEIAWAMAGGISAEGYASEARRAQRRPAGGVDGVAGVFAAYVRLKRRRGVIDFDDVLLEVLAEAGRDGDFADGLRWRFRHLLVDEAQDLNPVQHRIVDLLREGRDDLFVVGDPAQAVYGFNGADPSLLVEVESRFPGIEIVRLPLNHRCTPQIVAAGAHVLSVGDRAADVRSARDDGEAATVARVADEDGEAALVATRIARSDPSLVRSGGVAVLARTNAQLATLETALSAVGVAVRRSATGHGSPLQSAIREASSASTAWALRAWAHDTLDDVEALQGARARSEELERRAHADRRRSEVPPGPNAASHDPRRASRSASATSTQLGEARAALAVVEAERRVASALLDYLRDQPRGDGAGFRSWVATTDPFRDRSTEGVDLLTFHAAKGREWHTVFVTGVETSLVPHRTATTAAERAEEARLLYVAITRATDVVVLTHAARRGGYGRRISPFVEDLDVSEPDPVAPPRALLRARPRADPAMEGLRAWRAEAARRARIVPTELMTDRDLGALARERPRTAEEIDAVTSIGLITARRLAPELLPLVAAP
ncbi:ATP-dependent helicase [Ilumatobacter sp.]|uniref:ATP-dependent helicase n=1 Tax=Ilumatobacter sp. TaxID=1967498 RepID=UPI003B52F1AB